MDPTRLLGINTPKDSIHVVEFLQDNIIEFFLLKKSITMGMRSKPRRQERGMWIPSTAPQMFGNPIESLNLFIILYNLFVVIACIYVLKIPKSQLIRLDSVDHIYLLTNSRYTTSIQILNLFT